MSARGRVLATALALSLLAVPASAQIGTVRLRSDNDAYRFWVPIHARPDQEYTNGLEIAAEIPGAPLWGRAAPGAAACPSEEATRCAVTTLRLGQKIYTPRVDARNRVPGDRPYAGWLYAGATAALGTPGRRRLASVEVGVTGEPSAAGWVQTSLHRALGFWRPEGWAGQIPFEPGLVVEYGEEYLATPRGAGVVEVIPAWAVSAGNVRTQARAGVRGRLGYRLDDPWAMPRGRGARPLSLYLVGEVRGRAVAHDLFLDGSTFGGGPRVERIPWVGEWEAGVGMRLRAFAAEYRVTTRSREYRTEPGGHQYGTFELTLRRRR